MNSCTDIPDTGLRTLAAEGLDLSALDDSSTAELLKWHNADRSKPDADLTVLLWIEDRDGFSSGDWAGGWWDGAAWRLCESGGECSAVVAWAEPAGPAC